MFSLMNAIGCAVGKRDLANWTRDCEVGQTKVVNMRPGWGPTLATGNSLGGVFQMKMLLETLRSFKGDKTFHTHEILFMLSTVFVQSSLVTLDLETDFTRVMLGPDVKLELEERGQVHLETHFTRKPGSSSGRGRWSRTDVRDERTIIEKHILTNCTSENLCPVDGDRVFDQFGVSVAGEIQAVGASVRVQGEVDRLNVSEHHLLSPGVFVILLDGVDESTLPLAPPP